MHLSKNDSFPNGSENCGAGRDRTDDIQLAKLALSQLSYSPSNHVGLAHLLAVFASPNPQRDWWA